MTLVAEHAGRRRTRANMLLAPGDDLGWDPVLARGRALRGMVVDPTGRACTGWRLYASTPQRWRGEDPSRAWATTDEAGRFEMAGLVDGPHDIECFPPGATTTPLCGWRDVRPGPDEHRFEVPAEAAWAHVEGCVVDAMGAPAATATVWTDDGVGHGRAVRVDPATGAFAIGPIAAGALRWEIRGEGLPRLALEGLVLRPGETRDVGDVVLPPVGRLVVELVTADGGPTGDVWIDAYDGERLADDRDVEEGRVEFPRLYAGTYRIELSGDVAEIAPLQVVVRADETVRLRLEVVPGLYRVVHVLWPVNAEMPRRVHARVRDDAGAVVASSEADVDLRRLPTRDRTAERREGWMHVGSFGFGLVPGAYTIEVGAEGGATASVPLIVAEGGEESLRIRVGP